MSTRPSTTGHGILPSNMIPLGFGCGGLLHGLSQSESLRLLETAIDCGVTYFDTARMYGGGDAEGLLGTLTPSRRQQLVIASKAGILPPNHSIPMRALSRGVRLLHKVAPKLKDHVAVPAAAVHPRPGIFDLPSLRKSVETSLKELRTDYLDIFLLHECTEADVTNGELLHFLQSLQQQGKIRAFGLATGIDETIKITKSQPLLSSVLQIASSIWNMNIKRLPVRVGRLTITHSTLTGRFHELTHRISSDDSLAKQWTSALQIDPRDKAALAQLLLAYALHLNPDGPVLVFSSNPENIRASVRGATGSGITAAQVDSLNALIRNKEQTLPLEGIHRDHLWVS
jgi:D-threo-aldose 1-dehydrogenase